jgi:hypothetical protein
MVGFWLPGRLHSEAKLRILAAAVNSPVEAAVLKFPLKVQGPRHFSWSA